MKADSCENGGSVEVVSVRVWVLGNGDGLSAGELVEVFSTSEVLEALVITVCVDPLICVVFKARS